jgi:hypothetical protein
VPLTLVAGIRHQFLGSIDWHLLGFLLAGSPLPASTKSSRAMIEDDLESQEHPA